MYCIYGLQEEAKQNREQKLVCLEDSWEKLYVSSKLRARDVVYFAVAISLAELLHPQFL